MSALVRQASVSRNGLDEGERDMKPVSVLAVGISVLLSWSVSIAQTQTDAHASTRSPQGLRQLLDREAIRTLLIDYGRYFDARDFAAYASLFAADGVWVGSDSDTPYVGPDAIRGMVENGFPPSVYPGAFHLMTSITVELTGEDTATAWSRWTFVIRDDDGNPVPLRAGHYEDMLVRDGGIWKFARREVFSE
jgi:uncharacterized protein (TIGR02246 family)